MTVTITGIVLTYNNIHTIRHCIESLRKFDEILVLDSGSTDGTKEYLEKNSNITLYEGPLLQGHWIEAHNFLILESSSSHCFYLDSDEIIHPNIYNELKEIWTKQPICYPVTHRATVIYKDRCKKERHPDPQFRSGPVKTLRYYNPRNTVHEQLDPKYVGSNPKLVKTKHIIIHNRNIEKKWCLEQLRRTQDIIRNTPRAMSLYDEYRVNTFEELVDYMKNMETFSIWNLKKEGYILPEKKVLKKVFDI
jgi:glycosyltransferase involved in cell wall biosynthesis